MGYGGAGERPYLSRGTSPSPESNKINITGPGPFTLYKQKGGIVATRGHISISLSISLSISRSLCAVAPLSLYLSHLDIGGGGGIGGARITLCSVVMMGA